MTVFGNQTSKRATGAACRRPVKRGTPWCGRE